MRLSYDAPPYYLSRKPSRAGIMDHKVDAELMHRQRNMLRSQGQGYIPPGGHRHSKSLGGTKANTANQSVMSMSKRPTRLPGLSMDQG